MCRVSSLSVAAIGSRLLVFVLKLHKTKAKISHGKMGDQKAFNMFELPGTFLCL